MSNESQRPLGWFEVLAGNSNEVATMHVMAVDEAEAIAATEVFLDSPHLPMGIEDLKSISLLSREEHLHYWRIIYTLPELAQRAGSIVLLKGYEQDLSFDSGDLFWPSH